MLNGLYYFATDGKQHTPIKCEIFNDEELFCINASIQIMNRFFKNLKRSLAATEAFEDFIAKVSTLKSDNPYEQAEVDRCFRSFIFEWRLYTEHWKNYIKELSDSVYTDEYIEDYQKLFNDLMDAAYKDDRFIVAHVIRNYVSHANEAVTRSHIGSTKNEFCVGRSLLVSFLDENIAKVQGKRRKKQLEEQNSAIERQPEFINLETVAANAMDILQQFETCLMNYQLEPQTLQAVSILTDAKNRVDDADIKSDV